MSNSPLPLIELLHRALAEPLGIIVSTNDPERLRVRLYAARREAMNPDFEGLSFLPSRVKPTTELWICKKDPGEGNPEAPASTVKEPTANGL